MCLFPVQRRLWYCRDFPRFRELVGAGRRHSPPGYRFQPVPSREICLIPPGSSVFAGPPGSLSGFATPASLARLFRAYCLTLKLLRLPLQRPKLPLSLQHTLLHSSSDSGCVTFRGRAGTGSQPADRTLGRSGRSRYAGYHRQQRRYSRRGCPAPRTAPNERFFAR